MGEQGAANVYLTGAQKPNQVARIEFVLTRDLFCLFMYQFMFYIQMALLFAIGKDDGDFYSVFIFIYDRYSLNTNKLWNLLNKSK